MSDFLSSDNIKDFPQAAFLKEFLIGHPGIIAGGCFRSIFAGSQPKDIDMFFESKADFRDAVQYFKQNTDDYSPAYSNKNVESFVHLKSKIRVECVKTLFGTPQEILNQFDFTIAKMAFSIECDPPDDEDGDWIYTDSITYHPQFFEHLVMKRLVVDNALPFPISTFNRCFKYAKYGFFPCRETKLKILRAINELPSVDEEMLAKSMYEGHD